MHYNVLRAEGWKTQKRQSKAEIQRCGQEGPQKKIYVDHTTWEAEATDRKSWK